MQNEIVNSILSQEKSLQDFFESKQVEEIKNAADFVMVPHRANNENFYDEYVLNDYDFPLPDNKYYQAITELEARLQNLVDRVKTYNNTLLEIEELELLNKENEIKIKNLVLEETNSELIPINKRKLEIAISKNENEINTKKFGLGFIKSAMQEVYFEFMAWKALCEKYKEQIKLPDYGITRQAGMEIKKAVIRHTIKPEDAKGGEVPLVVDWKELNKQIIATESVEGNNPFLMPYNQGLIAEDIDVTKDPRR